MANIILQRIPFVKWENCPSKKNPGLRPGYRQWSIWRESNPYSQLGKLVFYH